MSSLQIRALTNSDADYAARVAVDRAVNPTSKITVEELKAWDAWWDLKYRRYRFVAEVAGDVVATAGCEEWI